MEVTASKPAVHCHRTQERAAHERGRSARSLALSGFGVLAFACAGPALAQRWDVGATMNISAEASTNPDLLPSDQAESAAWINFNPGFFISGTAPGGRLRVNGGGDLGAQLRLSTDEGSSTSLRPNASLNAVLEAAENFFFIDARAQVTSQLDDPFLATTDPLSPNNTSTSYQFGVAPYIQGQLPYEFDYLVRSDNSWTNFDDSSLQFASTNSVNVERRPQPFGGVFNYTQSIVGSDIPDQGNLVSDVARLSLRYAPNSSLAFGVRIGGEKYNFALDPSNRSWQRYYGAEASWRPNDRTVLEGYWEDRLFGNAWQGRFSYRRPRAAISVNTSRQLTSTPQQFVTLPGQASVRALLDASLTTRIPDPVERQRAVDERLATGQVPAAFTAPIIINSEGFQIAENTVASFVLYDRLDTLAFSVFYNTTTTTPGIASGTLIREKTTQQGAEVTYSRRLTPRRSMNASASWRDTEDAFDASQFTTQTQVLLSMNWSLGRRTSSTIGARYQWIRSSVTNDATEAAIFASLNYSFN